MKRKKIEIDEKNREEIKQAICAKLTNILEGHDKPTEEEVYRQQLEKMKSTEKAKIVSDGLTNSLFENEVEEEIEK